MNPVPSDLEVGLEDRNAIYLGFLSIAWAFTFLTFPGWVIGDMMNGTMAVLTPFLTAILVLDAVLLVLSAGVLWKDLKAGGAAETISINPIFAFLLIYLLYPLGVPFYVARRLQIRYLRD